VTMSAPTKATVVMVIIRIPSAITVNQLYW
jgi:hypothetical protein